MRLWGLGLWGFIRFVPEVLCTGPVIGALLVRILVLGLGLRAQGLGVGFRVSGLGFRV